MSRLRTLLAALILVSTATFVVGTTLERSSGGQHSESVAHRESEGEPHGGGGDQERAPPARQRTAARQTVQTSPEPAGTGSEDADAHAGESAAHRRAEGLPPEPAREEPSKRAENGAAHQRAERKSTETRTSPTARPTESGHANQAELKPFGVDIESPPFVVLAALVSLALAAAAWSRPNRPLLLMLVAATMLTFTALDVREVFHQHNEGNTTLAVLATSIAALHLAAAVVAGLMVRTARRTLD